MSIKRFKFILSVSCTFLLSYLLIIGVLLMQGIFMTTKLNLQCFVIPLIPATLFSAMLYRYHKENKYLKKIIHLINNKAYSTKEKNSIRKVAEDVIRTERLLKEKEKLYRIVATNSQHLEFWSNDLEHIIYISPSCLKITGYDESYFIKRSVPFEIIMFDDDKEKYRKFIEDITQNRECGKIDIRIVKPDGEIKWISIDICPLFDDKMDFIGIRGSGMDISERIKYQEQIINLNVELRNLIASMQGHMM